MPKAFFKTRNGRLFPRYCPACGGTITEYGVEINLAPEEMNLINLGQWLEMSKKITDKESLYLPTLPFRQNGKFYIVKCDNFCCDFSPCPVMNNEWFKDLDAARTDFFNTAVEY